jgi:HD-like signal output (HDOD) protein
MESQADPRSIDYLRTLRLFQGVPAWALEAVAEAVEDLSARKGQVILQSGTDDGHTYFLVDGQVALEADSGERQEMQARPDVAATPLANLRPRLVTVTALSRISGFRVPDLVVSTALESVAGEDDGGDEGKARQRALENELGFLLHRDLQEDKAVLPSLPDLALKIRQAIEDRKSDAKAIAKWVEQDPAMAAKLVKTANSAYYARREPVDTCSAAVVRLGVRATQKLVMTFCMREVFQSTKPELRRRMAELWAHSADVAAISFVLAHKARGFGHDPEEVMLAGLLHDVGTIAVLNYAQKLPRLAADPTVLEAAIERLGGELGAMILRKWRFSPEIVAAARDADDWLRKRKGLADITDVVIVAQMHDRLSKGGLAGLPPMHEISAVKRVLGRNVTPDTSLEVIKEAQAQIADVRALLEG